MIENPDDNIMACIVTNCLTEMRSVYTREKMTVCFNLTERILRVFCVCSSKDDVLKLIDEFHSELKKSVEENYNREKVD